MTKYIEGYTKFKPHEESLRLDFAKIKDWLDYLDAFHGWELYIPSDYIKGIKQQAALPIKDRTSTNFDNCFLIGVLRTLDEDRYDSIIEQINEKRKKKMMKTGKFAPQISKKILQLMLNSKSKIISNPDPNPL